MRKNALSVLVLFISAMSWADPMRFEMRTNDKGVKEVWVIAKQEALLGELETLAPGSRLFHWGEKKDVSRWVGQGHVDAGEMSALSKQHANMAAGGGYYASINPLDSSHYGPELAIVEPTSSNFSILKTSAHMEGSVDFDLLQDFLRSQHVSGIHYGDTWYNLIDPKIVSTVRAPGSAKEILDYAAKLDTKIGTSLIFFASRKFDFPPHPYLEKYFPEVQKVLLKQTLNKEEFERLKGSYTLMIATNGDSAWLEKVRTAIKPQLIAEARLGVQGEKPDVLRTFGLEVRVREMMKYDIAPKEWIPELVQDQSVFFFGTVLSGSVQKTNQYYLDLMNAANLLEPSTLFEEMAKGGDPAKHPLLVRFKNIDFKQVGKDVPFSLSNLTENLLIINRALTGNPQGGFRSSLSVVEGDIEFQGKKYYHISEAQKKALESNAFIQAEFVKTPRGWLARHEFPSARTYKKFANKLSPALLAELEKAAQAGKLTDTSSAEFRMLTNKINSELVQSVIRDTKTLREIHYQFESIKLFEAESESTLRAITALMGKELAIVKDPTPAYLLSYENYLARDVAGQSQYTKFLSGLRNAEMRNSEFPKYFDEPEVWQVATDTKNLPVTSDALNEFVTKSKHAYSRGGCLNLLKKYLR